jgi:hypothetical protein
MRVIVCRNCGKPILWDAEMNHWYHPTLRPTSIWCQWDSKDNRNQAEPTLEEETA